MEEEKWKNKTKLPSHKATTKHNNIYGEWHADKGNGLNVHILKSVLNERALKIYFPKVHNSLTLLTLSNLTWTTLLYRMAKLREKISYNISFARQSKYLNPRAPWF